MLGGGVTKGRQWRSCVAVNGFRKECSRTICHNEANYSLVVRTETSIRTFIKVFTSTYISHAVISSTLRVVGANPQANDIRIIILLLGIVSTGWASHAGSDSPSANFAEHDGVA